MGTVKAQGWYHTQTQESCDTRCAAVGASFASERTDLICNSNNMAHVETNLRNLNEGGWQSCVAIEVEDFDSSVQMQTPDGRCKYRQTGSQTSSAASDNLR